MIVTAKIRTAVVAALIVSGSSASAQIYPDFVPDPHFEWDVYFGYPYSGAGPDGDVPKVQEQSPAQQKKNRQRLSQSPSDEALALASREYLPELYALSAEAGAIGKAALSDPAKIAQYRLLLKQVGLDSNNLAHVVTAYLVSISSYEDRGKPGLGEVPQSAVNKTREAVESTLVANLPPSVSALQLRAIIDETRAEFLLVDEIVRLSAAESAGNRRYIRSFLLKRSSDYSMFR